MRREKKERKLFRLCVCGKRVLPVWFFFLLLCNGGVGGGNPASLISTAYYAT
jgi:hypothetical protein